MYQAPKCLKMLGDRAIRQLSMADIHHPMVDFDRPLLGRAFASRLGQTLDGAGPEVFLPMTPVALFERLHSAVHTSKARSATACQAKLGQQPQPVDFEQDCRSPFTSILLPSDPWAAPFDTKLLLCAKDASYADSATDAGSPSAVLSGRGAASPARVAILKE